jgi:hypothetical protein
VDDPGKVKELDPLYRVWFPQGLDDPDLALMKVEVTRGEFWDASNGAVTNLWGLAKGMVSGQRANSGEHEKVDLTRG